MATKGKRDYRPKFHYTPEKGWINDPNGLVFDGENYHLFAQHYPDDTKWGPMHWAHAVSKDMLHWQHLPIALKPDKLGMCFSGSACMINGHVALMYTSHGDKERQSVAFSENDVDFVPYAGNPVIDNPGIPDFRDPKMFPNGDKYGVAVAAGDHVDFYVSDDLANWEKTGEFSDQQRVAGTHECPDMFPITAPDGKKVWCMIASMILPKGAGNRTQYVLGDFDGKKFELTMPFDAPEWVDAGWDDYAPVTYWGTEKPTLIGWATSWRYADRTPTGEYCGAMTFPRELSLTDTKVGLRLSQKPLVDAITGEYVKTDMLPGESFRIKVRAKGDFAVTLTNSISEQVRIILKDGEITIDRAKSGECGEAHEMFTDYARASRARYMDGSVELDILFDRSILEVFADEGTYNATTVVYPTQPYEQIIAEGCEVEVAPLV